MSAVEKDPHDRTRQSPGCVEIDGGIRLSIRVTPNAQITRLDGIRLGADGAPLLHIRVAALPAENAANDALIAYLAKVLGARKADIEITAGAAARVKRVAIRGDGSALKERITAWIGRET